MGEAATMNDIDLVVFDMAGTTVRDDGQVPSAFASALAEHGLDVSADQIRAVRGASKRHAILDLLPATGDRAQRAERVFATFRAHLARRYAEGVQAIAGAEAAFSWLREHNVRVALNTGFDRDTTQLLLNALGWGDTTVDAVVCGDDVKQGRPAPYLIFRCMEATGAENVYRVATVGDTTLDLRAAHNAGVRYNIGVLSGAHGRADLIAAPHTHIMESVADVLTLLPD